MRGEIYRFNPRDNRGHKQAGQRLAVVVQSDNLLLSTWLVAPTSTSARKSVFRPQIEIDGKLSCVLVEQTTVVNPETELGDFVGRLNSLEVGELNQALKLVFGLVG